MTIPVDSVSLVLDDITELFNNRPVDPLRGRFDDRSGLEYLLDVVDPSQEPLVVGLTVTNGSESEYTDAAIERAIVGVIDMRIARVEAEKAQIRRRGFKELTFGLCFLAVCLLAGSAMSAFAVGPEWFRGFLVEGLVIVGWIALWHPVDMLFFERLPQVREKRVLDRLRGAQYGFRRDSV